MSVIDQTDRQIIAATQDGLPLVSDPYGEIGRRLNLGADEVRTRMKRMLDTGVIRRLGCVPNHYALGLSANGMSVWDIDDALVPAFGRRIGELDFVSHCYCRPRHRPIWPYNLFAMVHGHDRDEVDSKVAEIAKLLGTACRAHDVLVSTRILKKTGLRIAAEETERLRCSA